MKLLRIHILGWTCSFRYPAFISGYQPSLPVPPLSTIYGLISSARGKTTTPTDVAVGYVFQSNGKAIDLETIYELDDTPLKAGTNIVRREILFEPELFLYLNDLDLQEAFEKPYYPLLLGRSTELASVYKIKIVDLDLKENVRIGGSIFPFSTAGVFGMIQALPTHFNNEIPRRTVGTRPYYLVDTDFSEKQLSKKPLKSTIPFLYDEEKNWGVYLHYAQ